MEKDELIKRLEEIKKVTSNTWITGFYSGIIYTMGIMVIVSFVFWLAIL